MPKGIHEQWPAADLSAPRALAQALPIEQAVEPVEARGGAAEASARMVEFLDERLESYTERNRPDVLASSGLSPWFHFGHASPHELLFRLAQKVGWSPGDVEVGGNGSREGWWRMPAAAESFLDELITWRELGHVLCHHVPNYGAYEELPPWALATLEEHATDPRPHTYTLEQFERAETHDPLWNAAQMQLREEGIIHNYLRMLWGKKILHWTRSPREALEVMVHLNNRWALDGRDPNSWAGIMWVLGRFDRAWGPERPVFGKVRYMTSDNTARKYNVKAYVARYQPAKQPALFED
jgi:deoxyribodipyrimidine photo-lyase